MLTLLPRKPIVIDLFTPAPRRESESPAPEPEPISLARHQLMDRIIAMNPTASVDFLVQFDDAELTDYLDHLVAASSPRGASARWVRPSRARGIEWADACV